MREFPARLPRVFLAAALLLAACGPVEPRSGSVPEALDSALPEAVGVEMLRLAGVSGQDVVYDLGSGDGRIVIAAARRFGARGVSVPVDPTHAGRAGVSGRVTFLSGDLFDVSLAEATVVTLSLFPEVSVRLRSKLLRELRPGTRIVSYRLEMGDWTADQVTRVPGREREERLALWVVPADVDGTWRLTVSAAGGERRYRAVLRQRFQRFTGSLIADDREDRITNGFVRGDDLSFSVGNVRFRGRVRGETAGGTVEREEGPEPRHSPWTAVRQG